MTATKEITSMNEATTIQQNQALVPPMAMIMTPMEMLSRAVSSDAPMEVIEKLMALQERWDASQARKAFDEAMSAAKAEIPVIKKNRSVGYESKKAGAGKVGYQHEDLGEIARTIDPILSRHGLSYRFRTSSAVNEPISVTCVISHRLGHSEENTLTAGRDDSGSKNSIQAVGSTITYLQRYTLKAALGLAAAADDDGQSAGGDGPISHEQVMEIDTLIENSNADKAKFLAYFKIDALEGLKASEYENAIHLLNAKKKA